MSKVGLGSSVSSVRGRGTGSRHGLSVFCARPFHEAFTCYYLFNWHKSDIKFPHPTQMRKLRLWWLICPGSFSYEVSPPGPTAFLSLWVSISPPPSLPSDTSSSFLCPDLDLPGTLSSSPHAWLLGQAGLSHIQAVLWWGHHVQAHRLEWRRGCWETQANFHFLLSRWGKLRPREGTGLTQGHTAGTPMPLPLQILPLCH